MPTVDLSTAALERLLALDAQRTPGEASAELFPHYTPEAEGRVCVAGCPIAWCYWSGACANAEAIAAAVNHLSPLARALLRLRTAVELEVSICQACSGTGRLPRREYDAASGEHEIVGWGSCLDCADLRAALKGCE